MTKLLLLSALILPCDPQDHEDLRETVDALCEISATTTDYDTQLLAAKTLYAINRPCP